MDPTYNVALTERQIRALKTLSTWRDYARGPISQETSDLYNGIKTTLENRLARIEAEKGAAK